MSIVAELLLTNLLAYLINLASNERSSAIGAVRERKLNEALEQEDALKRALASTRSIRDEIRVTCNELARNRSQLGVTPGEEPVWRLLSDDTFQADLTDWLMAGGIEEGNEAKGRLLHAMELALLEVEGSAEQIAFLKSGYFELLEKTVYSNPILAQWRHQLSLDYLREQFAVVRRRSEEAAGVFSPEKQEAALDRYCEKALTAWDIIDLSNLPEGDIHMATQKLLLRQLYMPLRIEVEPTSQSDGDEAVLARMEEEREVRRQREAGHFVNAEPDRPKRQKTRAPVGERLAASRRLVVLGDPGGGKTTMLRWMATAYLLRHKGDAAFSQIPDTQTLPAKPWIPVLIRCRDLGEEDLCRCFTDFLTQHLNKTELLPVEAGVMRAVVLDRVAKGEALLLVDGLDEITNPRVRMMFCQELERTAARYPDAHIVVTSRIVGYRDMPYRMGSGFEHCQIAELDRKDKDLFANRWVEVTEQHQSKDEKAKRAQELLDALHSNDRIERLTGNPMLLTTLALVKRKVGKLPNKRTKLYSEAVSVLLNWNPRLYQTIEEDEAIPQLEYLAYEMCRRGVQRLTDAEVLDLLENLRVEYPNIRAIKRREPHSFLKHLEERSSILIKSGGIWQKTTKQEEPVWEFRHLTFQEYLAARALLDGRFPGRDKTKSLAEQVAPLAGAMQRANTRRTAPKSDEEIEVHEAWREALRLLVADCKDDDVDDVLIAILSPLLAEDAIATSRPRAILASLCLADEPNVSLQVAASILWALTKSLQEGEGLGQVQTSLERAAVEVAGSIWAVQLKRLLIEEFNMLSPEKRSNPGSLWAMSEVAVWSRLGESSAPFSQRLVGRLRSNDPIEKVSAALTIMEAMFEGKVLVVQDLLMPLLACLKDSDTVRHASAWALRWLVERSIGGQRALFENPDVVSALCVAIQTASPCETSTRRYLAHVLGIIASPTSIPTLLITLDDDEPAVRHEVAISLGALGDARATVPLLAKLDDLDSKVRLAVIGALGKIGDKQAVAPLLAKLNDPNSKARLAAIGALGKIGDKQAVAPVSAKLDDPDPNVRDAVIIALGKFGDKQAVEPLLAKLHDPDEDFRRAVIGALGKVGDKQAVAPLLAKLDEPDSKVRLAVIEALAKLGDKRAVVPLLAMLNDPDPNVRDAVIIALGKFGDKQAVAPLLAKLDKSNSENVENRVSAGVALHILGESKGTDALNQDLASDDAERRKILVKVYARQRDLVDRKLLSRDIDAAAPWLDPREHVTTDRIVNASSLLNLKPDEIHSRYAAMAVDLKLSLDWTT